MKREDIRTELFFARKSLIDFRRPCQYLHYRFLVAPRLPRSRRVLERPINTAGLSMHVFVGHRDLLMCVWSLASFYHCSSISGQLFVHDDGSLTGEDRALIHRLFPSALIKDTQDFPRECAAPLARHPLVREYRVDRPYYWYIRKLIDPYFVSGAPVILVVDSDVLWFRRPTEIEAAVANRAVGGALMLLGRGHDRAVSFLGGERMDDAAAQFNSGIVLYHRDNYRMDRLTDFFAKIDNTVPEHNYFIEQAGYAYCLRDLRALPVARYHIKGDVTPQTVAKHYTSPRRPQLYFEGIRVLQRALGHE